MRVLLTDGALCAQGALATQKKNELSIPARDDRRLSKTLPGCTEVALVSTKHKLAQSFSSDAPVLPEIPLGSPKRTARFLRLFPGADPLSYDVMIFGRRVTSPVRQRSGGTPAGDWCSAGACPSA